MSGVEAVELEVRELVRRRGIDPLLDRGAVRRLVDEVVADYDERTLTSTLPPLHDVRHAARQVYDAVAGFGPLQRHLDDPSVEEIWINEPGRVFVAKRGRSELTTTILDEAQVRDLVEKMLKSTGRRVDVSIPFVDAILHNHPGNAAAVVSGKASPTSTLRCRGRRPHRRRERWPGMPAAGELLRALPACRQ